MLPDKIKDLITGLSVSVDVSTGDHDSGNRYFGTVTEVMESPTDKGAVTLLVQDASPNFAADLAASQEEVARLRGALEKVLMSNSDQSNIRNYIRTVLEP